jgi:hypothetical protein
MRGRLTSVNSSASDDLENPDKIRSLLKDLREARQAKSRDGLKTLDHSELSVRLFAPRVRCATEEPISLLSCQTCVQWKSTRSGPTLFSP